MNSSSQADMTNADSPLTLRTLPSVQRLTSLSEVRLLVPNLSANITTDIVRTVLEAARQALRADIDGGPAVTLTISELAERVLQEARRRSTPSLQRAINATGIVLHTGLGRARLAEAACEAILQAAGGHAVVEIDRDTGRRGSRRDHVRGLLRELTGAEEATVVNNCAGAVFLAVTTLAQGREVIISRGELVEIGGAFRMPDIILAGGATLVEVGTTNKTRISDYAAAITERTGLILRCRPSNFAIIGFTEETPTEDLVGLGRKHGIPVMDDQGSGALIDVTGQKGALTDAVQSGSDVITASGDKLMGGPQAGLILGKKTPIEAINRHPLARALRVDKLTLAALEATLRLYLDPENVIQAIPTLRYLTRTEPELRRMAQRLRSRLHAVLSPSSANASSNSLTFMTTDNRPYFEITLVQEHSQVGGGSLPGEKLPTVCVAIKSRNGRPSADEIASFLRQNTPPIFARIKDDRVLFDPRALEYDEIGVIAIASRDLLSNCFT